MTRLLSIFLLSALFMNTNAQRLSRIVRLDVGVGFDKHDINFGEDEMQYNPGGGIGLEWGMSYLIINDLSIYATLGYQFAFLYHYDAYNGDSNRTSFNFNRKYVTIGFDNKFSFDLPGLPDISIGGGLNYNIPGKFQRYENNISLGTIGYKPAVGLHLDIKVLMEMWDQISIQPGLRYRKLDLIAESNTKGEISALPEGLQNLNSSGLELSITFVKRLGK